jgi:uncharacterized protein (TIGR02996 family)
MENNNQEQRFLQLDPYDRPGWLVYSDWLEENNRLVEAELIRRLFNSNGVSLPALLWNMGVDTGLGKFEKSIITLIKKNYPNIYSNLIEKSPYLRSVFEIDKKSFQGRMKPFYQNGFWVDEKGRTWEAFSVRGGWGTVYVRLERPNVKAQFVYDAGGSFKKRINKGREYIPFAHTKEEATRYG